MITVLGVVCVGVAVAIVAPLNVPGYDTSYTLAWGRDLTDGFGLDFTHESSPTPHPLAVIAGVAGAYLPVPAAMRAALGLTVAMMLATFVLIALITRALTASRLAMTAAVSSAAVSAALWLLVLNASSDITYLTLGLGGVLFTLRHRHGAAIAVFMIAALLRPEAVLLALVPLGVAFVATRVQEPDAAPQTPSFRPAMLTFMIGACSAAALWLAMGVAGADPLIGLHSAAANAEVNANPRGFGTAVTSVLPGLAGVAGWVTVSAAALALTVTAVQQSRGKRASTARARTIRADTSATRPEHLAQRATITTGLFVGVALVAYLAQGLIGTPLVSRYLLLPAVLCVALAARCVPLAGALARSERARTVVRSIASIVLVTSSVLANIPAWHDVAEARQVRAEAFAAAQELLDTELPRACEAPFVVRSPALVALTSLALDRPLSDIAISGEPGEGVLLQPLTVEAAQLAGYGPMTPLEQQGVFPQTAPPRDGNGHWALYSSCTP